MTISVILFVFGAIVGSFLNVLGLRFNSGLTLSGRSSCPSCKRKLKALELIPIVSFFFLRGRCRGCRAKISWQYPIVETLTGILFVTLFSFKLSILENLLILGIFSIYMAIGIYDLRHKIIPDALVYAAIILALVFRFISGGTLLDWLSGPILFAFFASVWLISSGKAMGFGDAKLALSIGLFLGASLGFSAITLSFWIGAAYGLMLILFSSIFSLLKHSKKITMKSEIPFAPFIILGAWLALIFQTDLLHVSLF